MSGQNCGHNGDAAGRRCDVCRTTERERRQVRVRWRRRLLAENPELREHGTYSTYNTWGCNCKACTDAATQRRYRYALNRDRLSLPLSESTTRRTGIQTQPFGREWLADA